MEMEEPSHQQPPQMMNMQPDEGKTNLNNRITRNRRKANKFDNFHLFSKILILE